MSDDGRRDVYCYLSNELVDRTHSPYDGISVDFDAAGRIVGVEVLGVTAVKVNGQAVR